jgi:hypothetical protein
MLLRVAVSSVLSSTNSRAAPHCSPRFKAFSTRTIIAMSAPAAPAVGGLQDYDALAAKLKDISALSGISGLLGWDEMTMLPPGAADARAAQKGALASVIHSKSTDASIGELLERLQTADLNGLNAYQRATIREAAREYRKASAIPDSLVRKVRRLAYLFALCCYVFCSTLQ